MGAPGFDDAPLARVNMLEKAKPVTFVYPYYQNPSFLGFQLHHWNAYPLDLRKNLRVIIVDDGSPRNPAARVFDEIKMRVNVRLFRIATDVRWNWLAARNIGMHYARRWCVLTDMDHVVPADTLQRLMYGAHDDAAIYRFSRREHSGEAIHPHPNSMFMTREKFWQVGGYDEALSGHYGTDGDWRRRCAASARVLTLPSELVRHEYVGDSSTKDYKRKQPQDAGKKAIIAARGVDWKPKTLSFEYQEIRVECFAS